MARKLHGKVAKNGAFTIPKCYKLFYDRYDEGSTTRFTRVTYTLNGSYNFTPAAWRTNVEGVSVIKTSKKMIKIKKVVAAAKKTWSC